MLKQEDYKQHISEQFNTELEEIKNHLLEMGGKVEKQLIEAHFSKLGWRALRKTLAAEQKRCDIFKVFHKRSSCIGMHEPLL